MLVRNGEALISLKDAADVFRRKTGRKPCYETVRQYADKGLRKVVLETVFIGGGKYTSEQAIDRFIEAYTHKRSPSPLPAGIDLKASEATRLELLAMLDRTA